MARSRSKKVVSSPETAPSAKSSAGFYKKNSAGTALNFAPTAVHYPGGSLLASNHTGYTYPVEGWTYYESAEAAYAAEGLEMPAPREPQSQINIAERIAARRAMTIEEREAEREQREAERIARLESTHPEKAEQLKAKAKERKARREAMLARRAMTPEQRREESLARLEQRNPELAAKIRAKA